MTIKDLRLFQAAKPSPCAKAIAPPEAAFMVDRHWKVSWLNTRAEQLLHLSASTIIGKDFKTLFNEQRFGCLAVTQHSLAKGHIVLKCQTVFLDPESGTPTAVQITAQAIPDAQGCFSGAVFSLRDSSDAPQSFSLVLDNIADGVFTVDNNLHITSFNPAAQRILGWSQQEVLGAPCLKIFGGSLCGAECILGQSINRDNPIVGRLVYAKDKHGRTIPISVSAASLTNPEGEVIGGVGTFRDMTQTMTTELILESIADGVFTVDRNWRITSFNRAAETITGWKRQDAIGKLCSEVFQSDVCGQECAIAQSLYAGKAVANRTIRITSAQGRKIPISVSASPLADHDGTIIGGVETFRDLSLVTILRKQIAQRYSFDQMFSKNGKMQKIFSILPEIARSDSNVLILGESGTGKEVLAQAIHNASTRKDKPFVAVSCGALPETLLESELFGYKAGAFTDAKTDKQGRFAAAEKGTLFLDEIGDIPLGVQVKLLRVLQEKRYEPLGSNRTIEADARIIAATNRELSDLVQKGLFREDLFYRLNVVRITLPPLRERREDIPLLVEHLISLFTAKKGKEIGGISDAALALLMQYDFPGNIRELKNIIEYTFILCPGGIIQATHLPDPFNQHKGEGAQTHDDHPAGGPLTLEDMTRQTILRSLERHKWKKMVVCRELGISKDTLRRKIAQYQLPDPTEESPDGSPLPPE